MDKNMTSADYLLRSHSVTQIEEIEKKLQKDSDHKQDEIRRLICDKYADIFDAFKVVSEMRTSADAVLSTLDSFSAHVKSSVSSSNSAHKEDNQHLAKQSRLVAQYKSAYKLNVLTRTQDMVRKALEDDDIRTATYLIKYFEFILKLSPELEMHPLVAQSESMEGLIARVESRIWSLMSVDVKHSIKAQYLASVGDMLAALMILKGEDSNWALYTFLEKKTAAISDLLTAEIDDDYGDDEKSGVESMVLTLLDHLLDTITILHDVFFEESGRTSLLVKQYQHFGQMDLAVKLFFSSSYLSNYIPTNMKNYRIPINSELADLKHGVIKKNSARWIESTRKLVADHLPQALKSIETIGEVTVVLDSIARHWVASGRRDEWDHYWDSLATSYTSVWDTLLQEPFLNRLKFLIDFYADYAVQMMDEITDRFSGSEEIEQQDVSAFVWQSTVEDVSCAGLERKSHAITPAFEEFCDEFDSRWAALAEELTAIHSSAGATAMFVADEVRGHLGDHVRESALKGLKDWLTRLEADKTDVYSDTDERAILIAQFTRALIHLTPGLDSCLGKADAIETKNELVASVSRHHFVRAISSWLDRNAKDLTLAISSTDMSTILDMALAWEEVAIDGDEESSGTQSAIRVPQFISLSLHQLLQNLCMELNRLSGHAMPRKVIISIMSCLLDVVRPAYETATAALSDNKLPAKVVQSRAIQLQFDLHFMKQFLGSTLDAPLKRAATDQLGHIINQLDKLIDAIDLQIIYPHMQTNVSRALRSTSTLFGLLCPDNIAKSSSRTNETSALNSKLTEDHFISAFRPHCRPFEPINK